MAARSMMAVTALFLLLHCNGSGGAGDASEPGDDMLDGDGMDIFEMEVETDAGPDAEIPDEPEDDLDAAAQDMDADFVDPNEASPYGINIFRSVTEELWPTEETRRQMYGLLQEAGVTWVRDSGGRGPRSFTSWWRVEEVQGEWSWEQADLDIDLVLGYGFSYIGYLGRPPPWARLDGTEDEYDHPRDLEQFRTYVRAVVQRYGFGAGGKRQILYWEVGNEPNNNAFYKSEPQRYLDLLIAAYETVREVDPGARVILGGLGGAGLNEPGNQFEEYIFQNHAGDYFDIFNFHAYGSTDLVGGSYGFEATITLAKDLAETYGFEDRPVWLTETGSNSDSDGDFASDAPGEERQAADLLSRYETAMGLGIDKVFWFKQRDAGSDNWWGTVGILRMNLEPKPAYFAFRDMTGL